MRLNGRAAAAVAARVRGARVGLLAQFTCSVEKLHLFGLFAVVVLMLSSTLQLGQ